MAELLQTQINELEKNISNLSTQINTLIKTKQAKGTEKKRLENEIEIKNSEISQINQQIEEVTAKLKEAISKHQQLTKNINEKVKTGNLKQPENQQPQPSQDKPRQNRNNQGRTNKPHNKIPPKVEISNADSMELKQNFLTENKDDNIEMMQGNEQSQLHPMKHFDEIITGPNAKLILQAINDLSFYQPSKIQCQAIPILNEQKADLIAQAQIGSGITVAFLISMLLHVNSELKLPQTICLYHTHELTRQTFNVFLKMNEYTKFIGGMCCNNTEPPPQDAQLLFGTPASFNYCIKEKLIDVSHVNLLIIDEADAILERESTHFGPTMKLLKSLPEKVQYGIFSSTFPNSVIEFVKKRRPGILTIRLKRNQQLADTIQHWYTRVSNEDEAKECINELVTHVTKGQTIIFTRSKDKVKSIYDFLTAKGITCRPFSSDLTSQLRDENLQAFRDEEYSVLVTTDILSRGFDFPNAYLVINYQTPVQWKGPPNFHFNRNQPQPQQPPQKRAFPDCDTYNHRSGVVGRFGRSGLCFTIVTDSRDENNLKEFCSTRQLNIPLKFIDKSQIRSLPEENVVDTHPAADPPAENQS